MSPELNHSEDSDRETETSQTLEEVAEEEEVSLYMQEPLLIRSTLRLLVRVLVLMILPGFLVSNSEGQVTTGITADGSLGTTITTNGTLHNITGGTRPGDGPNLFHSFGQLNVGPGDTANFLNNSGLPTANILSRVTGGNPSQIFGILQTTGFSAASLYLLNPAGVIFGPEATLNVGGSFHASTADFLRLGDNGIFFSDLAGDSVLTMVTPEYFGFLNGNPSGITVDRITLDVPSGETISFVGGDIEISGGKLNAPNGQITLVSVASPSEVGIDHASDLQIDAAQLGSIKISGGANIQAIGKSGGAVVIRSGQLMIIDGSTIATSRTGPAENSINGRSKAEIDIQVVNDVVVDNKSALEVSVLANPAESLNPDRININAGHLEIGEGSFIQSYVLPNSSEGHGGDIILKANSILMRDAESQVMTSAGGLAGGGDIVVDVMGEMTMRGSSLLQTLTSDEAGKAGDIQVKADKINISHEIFDGPPPTFLSGFVSRTDFDGKGNTGDIHIETNDIQMFGGFITSFTEAGSEGHAGNIEVLVDGDFSLIANDNGGFLGANAFGSGNAGDVSIRGNNLRLADASNIQAFAHAGNSGTVDISLRDTLDVREASTIDTFTRGSGAAGDIKITAKDIFITGRADAIDPTVFGDRTGLSVASNPGTGPGGSLTINAESLQVTDQGSIRSITEGPGASGNINIMVEELSLLNGASITAESISTEDGADNAGDILLKANGTIILDKSMINTQSDGAVGGNIKLDAGDLIQLTDSQVTSRVKEGSGEAGSINIDPEFIVVQNSRIDSSADVGNGGDVTFVASSAILFDSLSTIDTSSQFGGNGVVDIQAPIQNLSGTIAPLPEETAPVTALYGARCAAGQGGNFSTFVNSKADSLSPKPSRFLSSPLLSPLADGANLVGTSDGSQSQVFLTASIAPLVLGSASQPTTACP